MFDSFEILILFHPTTKTIKKKSEKIIVILFFEDDVLQEDERERKNAELDCQLVSQPANKSVSEYLDNKK